MARNKSNITYFELTEHNTAQIFLFFLLTITFIVIIFLLMLPIMQKLLEVTLMSKVYNSGELVPYYITMKEPLVRTSYFFSWAVDIFTKTPEESRYWFNPILSLSFISLTFGVTLSVIFSSLLPGRYGYISQKIEREIANFINQIASEKFGFYTEKEHKLILREISEADIRNLHLYVDEWKVPIEDLKALYKAIKWLESDFFYRFIHLNDGLMMYMRYHFSIKYGNTVLGMVYIGAAVLIIIIGLRGLKFIPPTQPSLVLFALGLEFSLLIAYAFTLMYTKSEEEGLKELLSKDSSRKVLGDEFGSSKEIESLLKVFIKSNKKVSKK